MPEAVRTTCPYCGVGCGVLVTRDGERIKVSGDPEHPANFGRLCSKGAALGETLDAEGRLLQPMVDGRTVDWDTALAAVADGFKRVIDEHGPDAVAFYVSGQLLTEDYYVANKLMKGFIGSANIDTNSRLCMSSAVAAHKRAFGSDTVPVCYEDLEQADLVVLVGSNTAWTHPVLYQRMAAAKRQRPVMRVMVLDPRRTATCDIADLHLALKPGSDAFLFNGLLGYLQRHDGLDLEFIERHTEGLDEALAVANGSAPDIAAVAQACELSEAEVARFYEWFAQTERTVTLWSQGVNQSSSGVDKGNAIINVHLASGRIGRAGMGPFSITGQPNAMGGREVGGLANQLAAHMDFDAESLSRVARFWNAPRPAGRPGLKAVELFQAIERGDIKAVWIMATNPAVSLPEADRVRAALRDCELVVVSDCVHPTDTSELAHVLLPAAGWGEKDGTVTNSERRLSRQRAFMAPLGEARPDWWIVTQVARRMGFADAFPYEHPAAVLREFAALTALDNAGSRDLDLGPVQDLSDAAYGAFEPMQWPLDNAGRGRQRLFADGRFYTDSGRARLIAVTPRPPMQTVDHAYPLVLNTGRIRDQWHTMTRTAKSARLTTHTPEPFVQIHPADAARFRVQQDGLARLSSPHGRLLARVKVDTDQRPGSVFVPMHWSDANACCARVDSLVAAHTDPVSGQPESKHGVAHIEPFNAQWHGFILSRRPLELGFADYCVSIRGVEHWRHELAGESPPPDWGVWVQEHLLGPGEWLEYADPATGRYRAARLQHGRLEMVLFVAPDWGLPERTWLGQLFAEDHIDDMARMSLLVGKARGGMPDQGRTVCSCFNVGLNTILDAIKNQGLVKPEQIGAALKAGTNCGSCVPELREILARAASGA
ncbi:MAG: molybdopterin-dependent oxidoreductase [Gammaproteobacteria bacterium]